jgi:hypothetical protein
MLKVYADPVPALSEVRALSACTLDHGFDSHLGYRCLPSSFCAVLSCVSKGRAVCLSLVLPYIEKLIRKRNNEGQGRQRTVEQVMNEWKDECLKFTFQQLCRLTLCVYN